MFQKWFSKGGDHFLGIIISPYNTTNKTAQSELRCFTTATPPNSKSSMSFYFFIAGSALSLNNSINCCMQNNSINCCI